LRAKSRSTNRQPAPLTHEHHGCYSANVNQSHRGRPAPLQRGTLLNDIVDVPSFECCSSTIVSTLNREFPVIRVCFQSPDRKESRPSTKSHLLSHLGEMECAPARRK
jgi:hypothetical protein